TAVPGYLALVAGVFNLARFALWRPWRVLRVPLLWILHLGYLFIGAGFLMVFLRAVPGYLPRSSAVHAFTTGAMGTFIIGMMSRVSLGHTGRPLRLPKGFVLSYAAVGSSGLIRVGSGFFPDYYTHGILCSGILW